MRISASELNDLARELQNINTADVFRHIFTTDSIPIVPDSFWGQGELDQNRQNREEVVE